MQGQKPVKTNSSQRTHLKTSTKVASREINKQLERDLKAL